MRLGGGLGGRKSVKSRKQLEEEAYKAKIASGKTDEAPIFGDRGRERTANSRDRGDRNGSDRGDRSATRAPDRTADIYGPGKSDTFDRRAGSRERRPSSRDRRGNSRDRRGGGERER